MQQSVIFPSGTVSYLFQSHFSDIWDNYDPDHTVIITNEHIARLYRHLFVNRKILVIPPGEHSKNMDTITSLARELLQMEVSRNILLVGVGGGVVTDITGFLASVYMRGVRFGFVPTTLLGMVDAAIGGKNGVNLGFNKNIIGTISQPGFILYDTDFLDTLPDDEWSNGFAEIIKYACIFDAPLFDELLLHNISYYRSNDNGVLQPLIGRCVAHKNRVVAEDEQEKGLRKLLNFGHTAAHAIENLYELPHGKAVGIGMIIASMISAQVAGLEKSVIADLEKLLGKYRLPARFKIDPKKAMEILKMDKKRHDDMIDYIVLEQKGKAAVHALPLEVIQKALFTYEGSN